MEKTKLYYGVYYLTATNPEELVVYELTGNQKKISVTSLMPKNYPDDLISFSISGSFGSSREMYEFEKSSGIDGSQIWKDLKSFAWRIYFHQGDPFNYIIPENEQNVFMTKYGSICEQESRAGAGKNYVQNFSISRNVMIQHYANQWRDFIQLKDKPKMSFYFERTAYLIDETNLIFAWQDGREFQVVGRLGKFLLIRKPQTTDYHLKEPMSLDEIYKEKIPNLPINKTLKEILETVSGSSSTSHSKLDLYLLLNDESLEKTQPDPRVVKQYSGYYENLQVEGFKTRWGILTVITYRSDIDDYDVRIYLGQELVEETQEYAYSKELGFHKE